MITEIEDNKDYFIATKGKNKRDYIVYSSDCFRLSEIELLTLIKMCIKEMRSKTIGNKILLIYRDSTEHRKEITEERLNKIGITDGKQPSPTREYPKTK